MLIDLADASGAGTDAVGGKARSLGRLLRAGLGVPPGFVVSTRAYDAALADLDIGADPGSARDHLERAPLPAGLEDELLGAVEAALATLDGPVAVRSSATTEDSVAASAAGQHDTFLGLRGAEQVLDAVRLCWASAWSERAVAYRRERGRAEMPRMAVIVQRLVDADVAGVLVAGPDGAVVIEGSWGLGESVVGGQVTPDSWHVDGVVQRRTLGSKHTRADRVGTRIVRTNVAEAERNVVCLDDGVVTRLAAVGRDVAALQAGPQDVEWAVEDGRIWLLQSRPITAALPDARRGGSAAVLTGTPASGGRVSGPIRVVRGPDDFGRVRRGDVLVCRFTDPAWTPLFSVVAGVVTEAGGLLSHAAIVAREHGIPAVLAVPGATSLPDGASAEVDGTAGEVRVLTRLS